MVETAPVPVSVTLVPMPGSLARHHERGAVSPTQARRRELHRTVHDCPGRRLVAVHASCIVRNAAEPDSAIVSGLTTRISAPTTYLLSRTPQRLPISTP
jgi:hypothetical protein